MKYRITPDRITELKHNQIFVFGSNESGRHGKGAAKTAMKWGAQYRCAVGLQGRTFAIPTVNASITQKLPLGKVAVYVNYFIEEARQHPELVFLVTEIGCGLAGWKVKDIAPLFREAVAIENIHLPRRFWHKLEKYHECNK